MIQYVIPGKPITKKNSMQMAFNPKTQRWFPVPSKAYKIYEKLAKNYLNPIPKKPIDEKIEIQCIYHLKLNKNGSVPAKLPDLTNLLEATDDILVKFKVISDDNASIVVSHDGSRVVFENEEPYTEISIRKYEKI